MRPDLARVCAESGRLAEARTHVERCTEIVGDGEDWRGKAGHVALAEATVLAHENRMGEAVAAFARAQATLRQHRLRGDEADTLHEWGRALARSGERTAAAEKLDEAFEIYRLHHAGEPWPNRIRADQQQRGGS